MPPTVGSAPRSIGNSSPCSASAASSWLRSTPAPGQHGAVHGIDLERAGEALQAEHEHARRWRRAWTRPPGRCSRPGARRGCPARTRRPGRATRPRCCPGAPRPGRRALAVAPALLVAGQLVRLGDDRVLAQQRGSSPTTLRDVAARRSFPEDSATRTARGHVGRRSDSLETWPDLPPPGARRTPQPDSGRGPQAGGHPPAQGSAGRRTASSSTTSPSSTRATGAGRERGGAAPLARPGRRTTDAIDGAAPVRERSPVIFKLENWALDQALQAARAWRDAGLTGLRVGVNLSAREFPRADLVRSRPASARPPPGCAPSALALEITESSAHVRLRRGRGAARAAWPPWGSSSGSTTSAPATRPWSGSATCPRTASRSRAPS